MRYLLDTAVMSVLMRAPARWDRRLAAWLDDIDDQDLCTAALVVREIWDGVESNPARAVELARQAVELLAAYEGRIVPVDSAVAMMWSKLLKGRKRRDLDAGIAATARVYGLIVVTRNVKDFVGLGVQIIDPFQSPPARHEP